MSTSAISAGRKCMKREIAPPAQPLTTMVNMPIAMNTTSSR